MRFGLSEELIDKLNNLFSNYREIEEIIIYGSRAKGNFRKGSDIDLCFKGSLLNLDILSEIEDKIDDMLFPYTFDMVIFFHIENKKLIEHINRVGKLFYKKK